MTGYSNRAREIDTHPLKIGRVSVLYPVADALQWLSCIMEDLVRAMLRGHRFSTVSAISRHIIVFGSL